MQPISLDIICLFPELDWKQSRLDIKIHTTKALLEAFLLSFVMQFLRSFSKLS